VDKAIELNDGSLFHRDLGSGEPVLLLHGFAEDGSVWEKVAEELGPGLRLLIPDLPGSGRSPSLQVTTIESMAVAVKEMLDREGIERCILIGHSMGGYIALAFAEAYPERLSAFGFFHSTAYADTEEKKAARLKSIGFIREHGAEPFIRQSIPNLFAPETREDRPGLVEDTIDRYHGFSDGALAAYLDAMMQRPDRVSVLARTGVPVLFIIGEKDQVVLPEQVLAQVALPALSYIHILPKAGHMGMLEEPAAGAAIIQSFVNFVINL
jgi:pimeloyl-ACP methyl ester carboxylesterase